MNHVTIDFGFVDDTCSAPALAGARAVGADFLAVDAHGVKPFVGFDVRDGKPSERAEKANLVEPVPLGHRAGGRDAVPVIKDVSFARGVLAGGRAVGVLCPSGAGAAGIGFCEGLPDRVDNLVPHINCAHGLRRRRLGIDERSLRQNERRGPEGALVDREIAAQKGGKTYIGEGMCVGHRAVLEAAHLPVGAREVNRESIAGDGDGDVDIELAWAKAVGVGVFLADIHAVRQSRDDLAKPCIGVIEHRVKNRRSGFGTELLG